jgi:pimeloyl-ACP methyl ester carboxylesterase
MPEAAGIDYAISAGGSSNGGTPLVLVHGAGGSRLHWPAELRRLEGRTVYAIDLPGHGRSSGSTTNTIEGYTAQVALWMEAVGLAPAVVLGHSMGGAITQQLASDHRSTLAGMVLIGTGQRLPVNPSLLEFTASADTFPKAAELILKWQFSRQVDPTLVSMAADEMQAIHHSVMHDDLTACSKFDHARRAQEKGLDGLAALVICGQDDKMTPLSLNQDLVDSIPGAKLVTVPEAGHMVMLEDPAAVAEAIKAFLESSGL